MSGPGKGRRVNPYEALFKPAGQKQKVGEVIPGEVPPRKGPYKWPQVGVAMGVSDDSYERKLKSGNAVAIDFDGTITADKDGKTANPGMRELVDALLKKGVPVVIFSARDAADIEAWLKRNKWPQLPVTNEKSHEFKVYLDDRAMAFDPTAIERDPEGMADALADYTAWWEPVSKAWTDEAREASAEARRRSHLTNESSRSDRSRATYKASTAQKQRLGEAEQARLAKALGYESTRDNAAFDVVGGRSAIEVKTVMDNNNDKITVHPESRIRKEKYAKQFGMKAHTVAIDVRGGKRAYYYKAGVGAYRLGAMERVSLQELNRRIGSFSELWAGGRPK